MSDAVILFKNKTVTLVLIEKVIMAKSLKVVFYPMTTEVKSDWTVCEYMLEPFKCAMHLFYHYRISCFL